MVVDVSDMLNREDLRIQLFSTLRLYWDCIRVAVDDDDAAIRITKLDPTKANLYYRGFSRPIACVPDDQPEMFEFHELREPPWNQHTGMMTRYGDINPLINSIDDKFAIMAAGDAVDLRFDATGVPSLNDGQSRTYLLFMDGWAKDGDPNTMFAGTVEPLPFHGMSGYPYTEQESYPQDVEHQQYLQTWNTRPGRKLIPGLVPLNGIE